MGLLESILRTGTRADLRFLIGGRAVRVPESVAHLRSPAAERRIAEAVVQRRGFMV